jgi:hypothetical protein
MYRCDLCQVPQPTLRQWQEHCKTEHAEHQRPFKCSWCSLTFTHATSRQRHVQNCTHASRMVTLVSNDTVSAVAAFMPPSTTSVSTSVPAAGASSSVSDVTTLTSASASVTSSVSSTKSHVPLTSSGGSTVLNPDVLRHAVQPGVSFEQWGAWYQQHRGSSDPSLADNTIQSMLQALDPERMPVWSWWDVEECLDQVCEWKDRLQLEGFAAATVATRIRHLWWYSLFQLSQQEKMTWSLCQTLRKWSSDLMHTEHHQRDSQSSVLLLQPHLMILLKNRIVTALRTQQRLYWNPLIHSFLVERPEGTARHTAEVLWKPYRKAFMCWLELSTRFTGIPLRTQASKYLKIRPPDDLYSLYVAELVCVQGRYYRVLSQDKVGKTASHCVQPIPVGDDLSWYWHFYLTYVRPHSSEHWVFPNEAGGCWYQISKDLKYYLEELLQIPVTQLEPNGRFIHASRSIGLATYGLLTDFDLNKMRNYALLLRHSLDTAQAFYSIWSHWYQTTLALKDVSLRLGCTLTPLFQTEAQKVSDWSSRDLVSLDVPPVFLQKMVRKTCHYCHRIPFLLSGVIRCHCTIYHTIQTGAYTPLWLPQKPVALTEEGKKHDSTEKNQETEQSCETGPVLKKQKVST